MVTFLTSDFVEYQSSNENHKTEISKDNGFVDNLGKYWKEESHFLVFASDPDALDVIDKVKKQMYDGFNSAGLSISEIESFDHSCTKSLAEMVEWADVIYLAGGHCPTQNKFMKEVKLKENLEAFDGIIIGLSAGSVNAAENVYLIPEMTGEAENPDFDRFADGLGLTDIRMIPHSEYMETVVLDGMQMIKDIILPDSYGRKFYLITDGSYFLIENGKTYFYGTGKVIENGKMTKICTGEIVNKDNVPIKSSLWNSLMKVEYDMTAIVEKESGICHFSFVGRRFTKVGIVPERITYFDECMKEMAQKLVVAEEKQAVAEMFKLADVIKEVEENGTFARIVHFDLLEGKRAEAFRGIKLEGDDSKFVLYIYDATITLDYDWMTEDFARTGFINQGQKFLEALSSKDLGKYAVVYTNIKGFKVINDLFGEKNGDKVIFAVRDVLKEKFKPYIFSRFESDHFVMIVDREVLVQERLDEIAVQVYKDGYKQYSYGIRCGIYVINRLDVSIVHMVDRAKLAEKNIKDSEVSNYAYYDDEMREEYLSKRVLLSELKEAIRKKEFKVYYQPVVETQTLKIIGAEALLRWQHHSRGMISPGKFIPIFEDGGQISRVDNFVVNEVFNFLESRRLKGKIVVPCAVNLSRMDFFDGPLMKNILDKASVCNAEHPLLKVEVTESSYESLETNARDCLYALKTLGVQILLDDFGKGMSSLSTLESFGFDIVKLDMGFIRKIGENKKAEAIIKSTIGLAHAIDAIVVAEGVEKKEQYEFLKSVSCDMIQGYYFYKPMPEEEFVKLIEEQGKK